MENYSQIFYSARDERIFPGERYSFDFDYRPEENKEHRLFFTGEVETFYWWKSEYCSTAVYKRVTDSLVRGRVDAYGLKMEGADYPVLAFRKIVWKPVVGYLGLKDNDENWTYGVTVSAKNVRVKPDGYLRLCLEIRKKREGMFNRHTSYLPDEVIRVDLEEGSYDLKTIGGSLVLPDDEIANVQFILEGENFEGEVVFEAPYLTSSNGYNVMAPFGPDATLYHSLFNWFGVNLSRTEWPEMQILLNGREVFCDEFFERCHRYSEKEIPLPEGVLQEGKNRLEFHLISDWNGALPYRIHEVGIVSEDRHSFDVVSCPEVAVCGKEFSLLLDLSAPCTLQVQSEAKPTSPLRFAEGGLQAVQIKNYLRKQAEWLKELKKSDDWKKSKFRVVLSHIGLFACEGGYLQEYFLPVLNDPTPEGRIHAHIVGHEHLYNRINPGTKEMRRATAFTSGNWKVFQDRMKKFPIPDGIAYTQITGNYTEGMTIDVTPDKLIIKSHAWERVGGGLIDACEITPDGKVKDLVPVTVITPAPQKAKKK